MKRYGEFVVGVENPIKHEVSEGTSEELIIRALNIATANVYFTNYVNPPIPEGYKHFCGEWNNGFVIERCFDGSQFVWIPVGSLDSNGTPDGVSFTEKIGRRFYLKEDFLEIDFIDFYEMYTNEFDLQAKSIKKYGGFYISRYNISKNKKTGKPQSVKGVMPWIDISFDNAKKIAATIEDSEMVKSHLPFGEEYDSVLEWFIKSKVRTRREIAKNSTKWGNYSNSKETTGRITETGSREQWRTNNIYDFAGNLSEWTQERNLVCQRTNDTFGI